VFREVLEELSPRVQTAFALLEVMSPKVLVCSYFLEESVFSSDKYWKKTLLYK
jgi:hypothetical protein